MSFISHKLVAVLVICEIAIIFSTAKSFCHCEGTGSLTYNGCSENEEPDMNPSDCQCDCVPRSQVTRQCTEGRKRPLGTDRSECTCDTTPLLTHNGCPRDQKPDMFVRHCDCECIPTVELTSHCSGKNGPMVLSKKEIVACKDFTADATKYSIIINNRSPFPQHFFVFQEPADYTGGPEVYSNSLGTVSLKAYNPSAPDQGSFTLDVQYRAGAQKQMEAPVVGEMQSGKVSTALVNLMGDDNPQGISTNTDMTLDTEGRPDLHEPYNNLDVAASAFRISTPIFQPGVGLFNIGTATVTDGILTMSSFITAQPNKNFDVRPIVKFYIATGAYVSGTVVDFISSSSDSAKLDATSGKTRFVVTYEASGTWTVS